MHAQNKSELTEKQEFRKNEKKMKKYFLRPKLFPKHLIVGGNLNSKALAKNINIC